MKTLFSIKSIAVVFTAFLFVFIYSCKKEGSLTSPSGTTVTEQDAANLSDESTQADASFDDVADVTMVAADEDADASSGNNGRPEGDMGRTDGRYFPSFRQLRAIIGDCATITVTPNDSTYPKTITIDFGDSCVGLDGKKRSGSIVINLTGPIRRAGSVMTITFVDFHLNRAHLEGTKVISNLSSDSTVEFTVQVVGGKVTFPNGHGYSFEGMKHKKQVEGLATATCADDVFKITGWAKVTHNNGTTVNIETVDPLIRKVSCPWLTDGTLKIKINDRVLKLDYGFPHNGDCDDKALLTWNDGNSQRVITLP